MEKLLTLKAKKEDAIKKIKEEILLLESELNS